MTKVRLPKLLDKLIFVTVLLTLLGVPNSGTAMGVVPPLRSVDADGQLQWVDRVLILPPAPVTAAGVQQPATTQMSEGFEGAWPTTGWELLDNSVADGGEYLLGKRTCHPRTGSAAGWTVGGGANGSALGCTGNYPDNIETWAIYGPIDLTQATAASLRFHVWGRTEAPQGDTCYDGLFVGSFTDDTDLAGGALCGDATGGDAGNGYYQIDYPLDDRLGVGQVWLALAFFSDSSITDIGFTLDDVSVDVTVTPSPPPPARGKTVYLPLIAKPPKVETPPAGTAFEWIKRTLETPGAQENFVLDTSRCAFNSAYGFLYYSGVEQPFTAAEAQSRTLENMKAMIFRAKTGVLLGDYMSSYAVTPAEITYPAPDRLRLHLEPVSSGTNTLNFTGDIVQNEMQIDYSETASTYVIGVLGSVRLVANFRCSINWVPPSQWTPMRVTNVQASDNALYNPTNKCFHVTWQPATSDAPAAKADKYELTLVGDEPLGTVQVPGASSQFDDCSSAAQAVNMCNNPVVYYQIMAVSATGLKSQVATSSMVPVYRRCW